MGFEKVVLLMRSDGGDVWDMIGGLTTTAFIQQRAWQMSRDLSTRVKYSRRRSVCCITLLVAVFAANQSLGEANWTTFRGPTNDGIAAPHADPPVNWSSATNIAFRTELPGEGWSTPIVANGRIYLSAAFEKPSISNDAKAESKEQKDASRAYDLALLIVDAKSGDLLKQVTLFEQTAPARIHSKNSHASSTPLLHGDRVYVHFGYQGTCCTDLDGTILWTNRELSYRPVHGNGSTPVLVDNRLIFTCDGASEPKVVALDADTGKIAWQTARLADAPKKFAFCSPTLISVRGVQQLVSPGADCVMSLNPKNGEVIWNLDYTGYSVVPKPLYHGGKVMLSTSFDSPSILAIDPTGTGNVTDTHLKWEIGKNAPQTPSMLAHNGLLYSVSDGGVAMCADIESGDVKYRKRIGGNFSASPVLAADRIYFTDEDGKTTVVQTGPKFKKLAENDLGERTLASMAMIDDAIILRTAEALYRIEE